MRNLFEEYGYSKFDIENKVIDCWNEIFDPKNPNHFYFDAPDNTGYMEDTGNDDARTEGMSYGMMMALQMNRKDIFDRIWKWARVNMYLEDGPNKGFFCWSNQTNGKRMQMDLLQTVKNILQWLCFLLRTAGETAKAFLITLRKLVQF